MKIGFTYLRLIMSSCFAVNGDVTEDDKVSIAPFDKASIVSESGLERRGSSTSLSNRFSSLMKTDFIRADSKKKKKVLVI